MRAFVMGLMLVPLASACNSQGPDNGPGMAGSGSGSARSYAATGFTNVMLTSSDDVDVRVGGPFSVRAEGPEDALKTLRIDTHGNVLEIGRRNGVRWRGQRGVHVHVVLPRLAETTLTGSGTVTVDRIAAGDFTGTLTGSGTLALPAVATEAMTMNLTGSGTIRAAGTTHRLSVNLTGSGDIDAPRLVAQAATVSSTGSGSLKTMVDGGATVAMMGSGDVDLGPRARCSTTKMGSGSVRCGN